MFQERSVTVFVWSLLSCNWQSGRSEETTQSWGTHCLDVNTKNKYDTENELASAKPT